MIVTFCGHAEVQKPEAVRRWLMETVEDLIWRGVEVFYLGGYGGFDTLAASVVRELKQKHPRIQAVLVLPYLDRTIDASMYDGTMYPPLEAVPRRYAIVKRNEYMIACADVVVAYVLYSWGGAAKTLHYARGKKKTIIQFRECD